MIVLSLGLGACALIHPNFTRPMVSVVGVQFVGGNLLQQDFRVTLKVQNPNDRVLPVSHLSADLRTDGEEIASGESARAFDVPPHGEANFEVMVSANIALAMLQLAKHRHDQSDAINYDVTGSVTLNLPFLRAIPFHQSGTFSWRGDVS